MVNKAKINALLEDQWGYGIQDGYNYAIFSIHTKTPQEVAEIIREHRKELEERLGMSLLSAVCYTRPKSVVIPIPYELPPRNLSRAIMDVIPQIRDLIPMWS